MLKEFDPAKSIWNAFNRGLPFSLVDDFDWQTAQIAEDVRFDYPERRWTAVGYIGKRLHVVVFCDGVADIRIISLRKANRREVQHYETATTNR